MQIKELNILIPSVKFAKFLDLKNKMNLLFVAVLIVAGDLTVADAPGAEDNTVVPDVTGSCTAYRRLTWGWNRDVACRIHFNYIDAWNCYTAKCFGRHNGHCDRQCRKSKRNVLFTPVNCIRSMLFYPHFLCEKII